MTEPHAFTRFDAPKAGGVPVLAYAVNGTVTGAVDENRRPKEA